MTFNDVQTYVGFAVNITFLLGFILTLYQFYVSENAPKLHQQVKAVKQFLKAPPKDVI